ncbi:MAG: TlpA disulfide reductase family protein [Balneolales bacterium]
MKLLITILLFFVTLTTTSCAQSSEDSSSETLSDDKIQVIQNTEFTDLDGNKMSLKDFEGKTVLIDIWETWCAPCIASMPTLHQLAEDYSDDFAVVALSPQIMDSPEQVEEFVSSHDYNFTYVYGRDLAIDLEIQSIPYKIFVGPDGKYLTTIIGSHGPDQDYVKAKAIIEANTK